MFYSKQDILDLRIWYQSIHDFNTINKNDIIYYYTAGLNCISIICFSKFVSKNELLKSKKNDF